MDKVFSTRVDESVVRRIGSLARRLRVSKKKIVEDAVRTYAAKVGEEERQDVFEQTSGAWRRKKSAEQLVADARKTFRKSMGRRRS